MKQYRPGAPFSRKREKVSAQPLSPAIAEGAR